MNDNEWHDKGNDTIFHFNDEGKFVDSEGNGPQKGFLNNNEFCDWLTAYVQRQLIRRGLKTINVPNDPEGSPIYFTPNAFNNPEKLLVLICGSGRIHAGLWCVGVCAYSGLNAGSILPCLDEATKREMEVVVLNPNHTGSRLLKERYNDDFGMITHSLAVFEDHIIPANPSHCYIICHSMGGICTLEALEKNSDWFLEKVRAVAMTDACTSPLQKTELTNWCMKHCINWVRSKEELNEELSPDDCCSCRSAATNDHPLTTWKAFQFIWEFFDKMSD